MKTFFKTVSTVIILLLPLEANAQLRDFEKIKQVEDSIVSTMKIYRIPGLSVAFYKDDFYWSKGYGFADLENNVPATSETAYIVASVMKPITALAVVKLAEEGKIDLDKNIRDYVPYYPEKKWPITIRQILGHQAGIGCSDFKWEEYIDKITYTTKEAIDVFKDCELQFEPGTKVEYSNWGYNLLGLLIEEVSGQTYEDFMTENIWGPLDMNHTRLDNRDIIPNRCRGYEIIDNEVRNSDYTNNSLWFAAGGGRSTVVDLIHFAQGLDQGKVVSLSTQQMIYEPMVTRDGTVTILGMGWTVLKTGGRHQIYKNGGQYGTSTFLYRIPGEKFAIALACNLSSRQDELLKIAKYVAELYLN